MSRIVFPLFAFTIGAAVAYLAPFASPLISWVWFLASIFGGIAAGYVAAWTWNFGGRRSASIVRMRLALLRLLSDFRVTAVLIGLLISYVITFYFAGMAFNEKPPGFWLAFYASWVSGLLFFTIVGLIAGLVALYRPEHDVFAARVKILTGGKIGSAVDYIASELRRIGYVAKTIEREIFVDRYSQELDAYYLIVSHTLVIRNIYDDVATTATGEITIELDALPNDPNPYGEFISFQINGTGQEGIPFQFGQKGFSRTWEVDIPA